MKSARLLLVMAFSSIILFPSSPLEAVDVAVPGTFGLKPCASATELDCIESFGRLDNAGNFVAGTYIRDYPTYVPTTCPNGTLFAQNPMIYQIPGLANSEGSEFVVIDVGMSTTGSGCGPSSPAPDPNREKYIAGMYVTVYGSPDGNSQSMIQLPNVPLTQCAGGGYAKRCQYQGGPGDTSILRLTVRVAEFSPGFASGKTSETKFSIESIPTGGSRYIFEGRALNVPGVLSSSSFDEGTTRTAAQADFLEQMWQWTLGSTRTPGFPNNCAAYGFPVISGNHRYGGETPSWNNSKKTLELSMGAMHYAPDGSEFRGIYEARLPIAYASCMFGVSTDQLLNQINVSVIAENGTAKETTASIQIIDGVLAIDLTGFTFSQPTIVVKKGQAVDKRIGFLDGNGTPLRMNVLGKAGVPTTGVEAVSLNVTATDTAANNYGGYATVYPCSSKRPSASNLNFGAGQTIPNSVIAPVDENGNICFYIYGKSHVLADVSGYFPSNSGFTAQSPAPIRVLDTRAANQKVGELDGSGSAYRLRVTGANGVPTTGVASVALNVTSVDSEASEAGGFVTVYPCSSDRPRASNLNFTTGQTVANLVIAPVDSNGEVCFYVYGKTHLLADLSGWFAGSSGLISFNPQRLLDTRSTAGPIGSLNGDGEVQRLKIAGSGLVPLGGVSAAVLNITATTTTSNASGGYLSAYPCESLRPDVSNLNFTTGLTIANSAIVPLDSNGEICIYVYGLADVIVDISGYFTKTGTVFKSVSPKRIVNTR